MGINTENNAKRGHCTQVKRETCISSILILIRLSRLQSIIVVSISFATEVNKKTKPIGEIVFCYKAGTETEDSVFLCDVSLLPRVVRIRKTESMSDTNTGIQNRMESPWFAIVSGKVQRSVNKAVHTFEFVRIKPSCHGLAYISSSTIVAVTHRDPDTERFRKLIANSGRSLQREEFATTVVFPIGEAILIDGIQAPPLQSKSPSPVSADKSVLGRQCGDTKEQDCEDQIKFLHRLVMI